MALSLKIPRGSPGIPGDGLALLLQRQLRRQRRGLRLLAVEAAAAQEVLELGEQRHGAPSMAGLREDPPETAGIGWWLMCVWLVGYGMAWNGYFWNDVLKIYMNYKIRYLDT